MTSVLRIVHDVVWTDLGNEVTVSWALGPTGQQGVKRSYHSSARTRFLPILVDELKARSNQSYMLKRDCLLTGWVTRSKAHRDLLTALTTISTFWSDTV